MKNAPSNYVPSAPRRLKFKHEIDALEEALKYALPIARKWIDDEGNVYIPQIDSSLNSVMDRFSVVQEMKGVGKTESIQYVGYDVEDTHLAEWQRLYNSSDKAADFIRSAIATNVLFERRIPPGLRLFASNLLEGKIPNPIRKATKPSLVHRDTLLSGLAKKVIEVFDMKLGAAKRTYIMADKPPIRGCTVSAAALVTLGVSYISPERADRITRDRQLPISKAESLGVFFNPVMNEGNLLGMAYPDREDLRATKEEVEHALDYFQR